MFIDQKGKLFGKISIIDILVIVLIVVGIAGATWAYRTVKSGKVLTENLFLIKQDNTLDTLQVKMRLKEVRDVTLHSIKIGDEIYAKDTNKYIGEIAKVETESAKRIMMDNDGNAFETALPERIDVVLYVNVPGKRTENGYYTANNLHLVYDSSFEIKTPTIQTFPVIEGITVLPKENVK